MEIVETWYFQIWVNFGGMTLFVDFRCSDSKVRKPLCDIVFCTMSF